MTTTYNVLIIEDSRSAIELYEKALSQVENDLNTVKFRIDTARTCQDAYDTIQKAIQSTPYDFVFLDLRLPASIGHKIRSGEDLGLIIKKEMPSSRLIVLTNHFEPSLLNQVWNSLRPDSFVVKGDVVFKDLITLIEKLIDNKNFFSNSILELLKQNAVNNGFLDVTDMQLLYEITNGAKMKELMELLPLSKSGIEKRRSTIKEKFGDKGMSDRDMILAAKEKGFI